MSRSKEELVVMEVLQGFLATFASHGLAYVGSNYPNTPQIEDGVEFNFFNESIGLQMRIGFFPARGRNGSLSTSLFNSKNGYIDVEDYLVRARHQVPFEIGHYKDPTTDIRRFVETYFQHLNQWLSTDLKSVVDGKTFEPTPIDWQGYK